MLKTREARCRAVPVVKEKSRRIKMKKLLSVLLSAALTVGLLAGCGSSGSSVSTKAGSSTPASAASADNGEKKVIRVAWWGGQARADATTQVCEMYMAEHPDVQIEVEFSDYTGYFDKLAVEAASGTMPDIFQATRDHVVEFTDKGLMLPLNEYVDSGVLDFSKVSEDAKTTLIRDGKLYGIVLGSIAGAMSYDPDVVEQAGVEIYDGMPWSEFVAASKTIYEKTGVQTSFDSGDPITQLAMIARAKGYQMYSEDGTSLGFPDASIATEYFQRYEDGLKEGYIVDPQIYVERDVGAVEQRPIVDGLVWNDFGWSNNQGLYDAMQGAGRDMKMVSYPIADDATTPPNYLRVGTSFHVSTSTQYPEVCADFLSYFMNSVEANEVLNAERGAPVNTDVLADLTEKSEGYQKDMLDFMGRVEEYCSPYEVFDPAAQSEVVDVLKSLLEQVGYGKMSAEEAGESFFTQANEILQAA